MDFIINVNHTQGYLPTKRHRKIRYRTIADPAVVSVKEVDASEFPVAFIVKTMKHVYTGAKSYSDFNEDRPNDYVMLPEELRTYGGKLFTPVRVSHGAAVSTLFEPVDYIRNSLEKEINASVYLYQPTDFTEASILTHDNLQERVKSLQELSSSYIVFEGKVYEECGEPMYEIVTFGLGHNHGGTGFFITNHYNPNIRKEAYFNALHRKEALEYGKRIALSRGDTKSVDDMGKFDDIEVLIPEMVKRNPLKEHGDGDPFMNELEEITQNTGSAFESGLLTLMFTSYKCNQ